MLRYYLLGWGWFFAWTCAAQTVRVVDQADGSALPDVYVAFERLSGEARGQAITDAAGQVRYDGEGPIRVAVRLLGYLPLSDTLDGDQTVTLALRADPRQLGEVVVTGQYQRSPRHEVLQQTRVISAERIQRQGAVTLTDVLRNELNISLPRDNALGRSVSLQGLSGENVKIMVDGVPIVGRQDGILDLDQLQLDNVERIEIVEGPMSVKYGADALAGVINLITKKPTAARWSVGVQSHTESARQYLSRHEGTHRQTLSGSYRWGANAVRARAGRLFFGGQPLAGFERARFWNPKAQQFATLTLSRSLPWAQVSYEADWLGQQIFSRAEPEFQGTTFVAADDNFRTRRLRQVLAAAAAPGARHRWDVFVSRQDFERSQEALVTDLVTLSQRPRFVGEGATRAPAGDTSRLVNYHSRGAWINPRPGQALAYELGYEVQHETVRGGRTVDGAQVLYDLAAFATAEVRLGRWQLKPGVRWAYNSQYGSPLVPSLNARYRFSDAWDARLTYGRGFRAPSLSELYLEFVDVNHNVHGNPNLEAEFSHHLGAATSYRHAWQEVTARAELSVFHNDVRNKIDLIADTLTPDDFPVQRFSYFNVAEFRSQGFQASLRAEGERWEVGVGTGYTGRANQFQEADSVSDASFFYTPEVSLTVGYRPFARGPFLSLFAERTGRTPFVRFVDGAPTVWHQEAYTWLDLTASQRCWRDHLTVTMGLRNLTDVRNIADLGMGGAHSGSTQSIAVGRSVFFKIDLTFDSHD